MYNFSNVSEKIGVGNTLQDNYLRYFDPRPAGQRKGLQLIFLKSAALN